MCEPSKKNITVCRGRSCRISQLSSPRGSPFHELCALQGRQPRSCQSIVLTSPHSLHITRAQGRARVGWSFSKKTQHQQMFSPSLASKELSFLIFCLSWLCLLHPKQCVLRQGEAGWFWKCWSCFSQGFSSETSSPSVIQPCRASSASWACPAVVPGVRAGGDPSEGAHLPLFLAVTSTCS